MNTIPSSGRTLFGGIVGRYSHRLLVIDEKMGQVMLHLALDTLAVELTK